MENGSLRAHSGICYDKLAKSQLLLRELAVSAHAIAPTLPPPLSPSIFHLLLTSPRQGGPGQQRRCSVSEKVLVSTRAGARGTSVQIMVSFGEILMRASKAEFPLMSSLAPHLSFHAAPCLQPRKRHPLLSHPPHPSTTKRLIWKHNNCDQILM